MRLRTRVLLAQSRYSERALGGGPRFYPHFPSAEGSRLVISLLPEGFVTGDFLEPYEGPQDASPRYGSLHTEGISRKG